MSDHTPPSDNGQNQLSDHCYDGIQEYDNPLPAWWVWIFWITIIWSAFYLLFAFAAGDTFSPQSILETNQSWHKQVMFGALEEDIELSDERILQLAEEPNYVSLGASLFQAKCATCHGADAQGVAGSGPNMTDDTYIHIQSPADFASVIADGANNGAMPAWSNSLEAREIAVLSAYLTTVRGTNVSGVEAQGETAPPWPDADDSAE